MTDLEMLEAAMRKAWKHQLGFAFNQRYLQHRAEGQTVHSAIRLFEQEFKLSEVPVEHRQGLSLLTECTRLLFGLRMDR